MALTLHQKRGLFWGLGVLLALVLTSVAWAQIDSTLANCFSIF